MTRQDFKLIANLIASYGDSPDVRYDLAHHFAVGLKETNERFDVTRFVMAATEAHS